MTSERREEHFYDVIARVLRESVPEATENQVYHQLEYINVYLQEEGYEVHSGSSFLGPFRSKEGELRSKIEEALRGYYTEVTERLAGRVTCALYSMNAVGHTLWLREDKHYPVRGNFMGLRVRIHKGGEEFILSRAECNKVAFLEGGDGQDFEDAMARRRANILRWRREREKQ